MSREKGILETCDRCGATYFRKYICTEDEDGGYTTWDRYEDTPEGWGDHYGIGTLCPACNSEYNDMITKFMKRAKPDGA